MGTHLAKLALGLALVGAVVPAPAWAEPLDLADPTPRAVRVEFEVSTNPSSVGQTYSAAFDATYSATAQTGTVVISGVEYESAIQTHALDYFDTMMVGSLIPGSATAFRPDIDRTTLQATAPPATYQVNVSSPVQQIATVTRNLATTTLAGFAFLPQYPGFPFFCATCVLVPGAAYDPATGKINAVGSDRIVAPDFTLLGFSRAGDLRLSEQPAPAVPALSASGACAAAVALTTAGILSLRGARRSRLGVRS